MLKKYLKELLFICLILSVLIYSFYPKSMVETKTNDSNENIIQTSADTSNSEKKNKLSSSLLADLKTIDSTFDKNKVDSLSKANRADYYDNLGKKYIELTKRSYDSISELESNKDKITTEKQNALNNIEKAADDVKISYQKSGGGSGAGVDIPYGKMKAARQEVCNVLKTYLSVSDNDLTWKEMNEENKINDLSEKIKTDYININRKLLGDDNIAIPDIKINNSTPNNGNEKAYVITSSMIIPNAGLGTPKYYPIKMNIQYDKTGKYTFKYLDPNKID